MILINYDSWSKNYNVLKMTFKNNFGFILFELEFLKGKCVVSYKKF